MAFTFIAPTGFDRPETRAHVRLLGPCFKTGRMEPYGRQHPGRVVCEHHPIDRQQFERTGVPSATVDMPRSTTRFGLHSQTTRLFESTSRARGHRHVRGCHPLRRAVPSNLGEPDCAGKVLLETTIRRCNTTEIFKLSCSLFIRHYWGNPC